MNHSYERYALQVSAYRHIYPISLSVVKHLDNRLMGYLKYDRTSYGIESLGNFCSVRMEKNHGIWQMHVSQKKTENLLGLSDFIEAMNYVVFEYLQIDFDEYAQSLREFEKRDIFFCGIDVKINGTRISTMDDPRERQ